LLAISSVCDTVKAVVYTYSALAPPIE